MLLFLSLFITSKTLKGALEVIIRSQIATVFNRILFPNLIIFGNFWQLLATFGNFVNLGESCQKLLRTPPFTLQTKKQIRKSVPFSPNKRWLIIAIILENYRDNR